MRLYCAMCGRLAIPYAYIGAEPIGSTCAKNAGLTRSKTPKGGKVRFVVVHHKRAPVPKTGDLFAATLEELEANNDLQT